MSINQKSNKSSASPGYVLVELITVLAISAMLLLPISRLTRTLVKDIPDSFDIYMKNETLLNAVTAIKSDMYNAKNINVTANQSFEMTVADSNSPVSYKFVDDILQRQQGQNVQHWKLPDAKLRFKPYHHDEGADALEVHSYISIKFQGKEQKKLSNNYLFFPGLANDLRGAN